AVARRELGLLGVVIERGRDDGARVRQELCRMAGGLGLRHREAHVGEQTARAAFADVAFGVCVWLSGRGAYHVDSKLIRELLQLGSGHAADCASGRAMRTSDD